MTLLSVVNLTKEFSGEQLFSPVSFMVKDHDRVAILGPNGAGKSTLIKMILGREEITSGQVIISKNVSVGYLSQDVIENPDNTLYEEALTVYKPLIEEEKKIHELADRIALHPDDSELLKDYSTKEMMFEGHGGYDYQYKIAMILNMFSFSSKDYQRKINSFSGGEKVRVAFAKLLLLNPDLLILDEPTNHLDIISIEWLEEFLSQYQGAVLFVSHDIAFVKRLANRILDIEDKSWTMYNCDYDNFSREKKNHYENLLAQYQAQEALKEKYQKFISFYMPKPRFSSRAQDRVKKLERLEQNSISDPRHKEKKLSIGLKGEVREGKKLFDFNNVCIGYDKALAENISFTLFGRDHLAIMGANGTGKSTFGKTILGEMAPLDGNIRKYFHIHAGVLRQDIRSYQSDETLFQHFRNIYPRLDNQDIYNGLGRYGFTYNESNEKRLCDLSGGELMRIELLQLSLEDYDLLLLDEPTNHLDMLSTSVLVDALNQYEGTLIIISHDRDFIDKTCNKLLYLYNNVGYYFDGPYSEFRIKRLKEIMDEEKEKIAAETRPPKITKKVSNPIKKTRTTREPPEKIMEKIDRLENRNHELDEACYLEENYTDKEKMRLIDEEKSKNAEKLKYLYEELEKSL